MSKDGLMRVVNQGRPPASLHPFWEALIRYCADMQFGELEKVRIQNGLPTAVEVIRTKVRLAE
jgi:hypothetical protein